MAKKKSSFRGKVVPNAKKSKASGAAYGYLNLPRGVAVYSVEPGGRASFDIMPYRPFRIHRNTGTSNDAVVCLTSVGKRCPICEYPGPANQGRGRQGNHGGTE